MPIRLTIFVFCFSKIQALKNTERDVFTAEEMHTLYIREHVAGRTEQTPEYKVIRNSGHDGGDFVFVKRKQKNASFYEFDELDNAGK